MSARTARLLALGDAFGWLVAEATPDAILLVSASGFVEFANSQAGGLFGVEPIVLLGASTDDLLPGASLTGSTVPAPAVASSFEVEPDATAWRADGAHVPVEVRSRRFLLDLEWFTVITIRDVTERIEEDAQLHRLLQTLDALDEGIFIFDAATLAIAYVNDGAVRLTGYERSELLSLTFAELDGGMSDREEREIIRSLATSGEASLVREGTLRRCDGTDVFVETMLQPARTRRNRDAWVIGLTRDISERVAHAERVAAGERAIREAETFVAVMHDRERIARDLHDTVIQQLFGEGLSLQSMVPLLDDANAQRVRATITSIDDAIKQLRSAVFSLQGATSAPDGIRSTILDVVTQATAALDFEPRLQFDGSIETLDQRIVDEMVPVLREALSNVVRHAHATEIRVGVTAADHLVMTVTDNGVGVPDQVIGGRGLTNMNARAGELGGGATIVNRPSGGTVLTWQVPLDSSGNSGANPGGVHDADATSLR